MSMFQQFLHILIRSSGGRKKKNLSPSRNGQIAYTYVERGFDGERTREPSFEFVRRSRFQMIQHNLGRNRCNRACRASFRVLQANTSRFQGNFLPDSTTPTRRQMILSLCYRPYDLSPTPLSLSLNQDSFSRRTVFLLLVPLVSFVAIYISIPLDPSFFRSRLLERRLDSYSPVCFAFSRSH